MDAAVMRFLVLGRIPGTEIEIGFYIFLLAAALALAVLPAMLVIKTSHRLVRLLNPFLGAPLTTRHYDLVSR